MRHQRLLRYVDEVARTGSIRQAAGRLNLTASALNRRIQDLEDELGTKIFERLPRGVRLNAAGELMIRHIRDQMADLARVRSQIEDLSGFRRGSVSIGCSQALAKYLLPAEIAAYRKSFPLVEFDVQVRDHGDALRALQAFDVDLAIVFRPEPTADFQSLAVAEQRVVAVMAEEHPLAGSGLLRLRDCARYPLALAERSYGGRRLLDEAAAGKSFSFAPAIESNSFDFLFDYVRREDAITFQIEVGAPPASGDGTGLISRPIDPRDVPAGKMVLGKLRGRALSVAAAKFADQLALKIEGGAGRGS